jgi:hypothetical protein
MYAKTLELALLATLALFCAAVRLGLCRLQCRRRSQRGADMDQLILERAAASLLSGKRSDDNYDVLGVVVGRIFKVRLGGRRPWMWTLAFGHQ